MKIGSAIFCAIAILVLTLSLFGCGQTGTDTTLSPDTTDSPEPLPPTCTEPPVSTDEPEENIRIIILDVNKDGKDDYRIEVDMEAARSTEAVPFRIADAENPSEDSFRTVSLYRLGADGDTLIWYTNLCMGSAPRGGVGLTKEGGIFTWYYDVYTVEGGRRLSLSVYEFGSYGNTVGLTPNLQKGSAATNTIPDDQWEEYGERNEYTLLVAVNLIDEHLSDAEILLDVTGNEPIFSTDENRFTKQYANLFNHRDLEGSLAPENQDKAIVFITK